MRDNIRPARLIRSRRARLLTLVLPLGMVLVAGCTGGSGSSTAAKARGSATPALNAATDCFASPAACYTPDQFRVAYGIQPLLERGIDGRGETVTVLEIAVSGLLGRPAPSGHALASPSGSGVVRVTGPQGVPGVTDIRQDMAKFDSLFKLPAAQIQVVTTLAGSASRWLAGSGGQGGGGQGGGEVGDLEELHMVAPGATLRVVLLPPDVLTSAKAATAGMLAGLRIAVSGTDVVSIGWDLGEHFFTKAQAAELNAILAGAAARHVTVVASSGDTGPFSDMQEFGLPTVSVKEVSLPASDPFVLAVGGTTLTVNPAGGAYVSETVWNTSAAFTQPGSASGGGFSHLYARPSYQDGVPGIGTMRGVPDVAGDADPADGAPVVLATGGTPFIVPAAGTEAAVPLWAGLIALADQYAHHDLGFVNPAIYRIARSSSYHEAFHDITTGNNIMTMPYPVGTAGYKAVPGWDPATGWGSPDAQVLVPLLAG